MPPKLRGSPPKVASAPAPAPAPAAPDGPTQEERRAKYLAWLNANDVSAADDDIQVTDTGIIRTAAHKRSFGEETMPDPPGGANSMVNDWLPGLMNTEFATLAAKQSVRQYTQNGVLVQQIGWDKAGTFHPVRHFHSGAAYERYRRGLPPGYTGYHPHDAVPVTGGKIGVIEKKHPILYSKVRPATGFTLTDIMDDKFDSNTAGVGEFEVHTIHTAGEQGEIAGVYKPATSS